MGKREGARARLGRLLFRAQMSPAGGAESGRRPPPDPGAAKVQIYLNTPLPGSAVDHRGRPIARFPTNKLNSTKYTPLTFLPKNLFEQFRRVANCFFLLLAVLQSFPQFETIDPLVAAVPLILIMSLTAIKDGVEDWKRHSTDASVNHRTVYVLGNWTNVNVLEVSKKSFRALFRHYSHKAFWGFMGLISKFFRDLIDRTNRSANDIDDSLQPAAAARDRPGLAAGGIFPASPIGAGEPGGRPASAASRKNPAVDPNILSGPRSTTDPFWRETFWKNVRAGDVIFLRNNEFIPADVLILSSSEPEGLCYVQTKNLDGETNLKIRNGLAQTAALKTAAECASLRLRVDSEPPTANLFSYNGTVVFEGAENEPPKKVPVTLNSMLLRGCILRNTEYVIGIVVFTGADTKIQLNSGETPSKRTAIEKAMNPQVYGAPAVLILRARRAYRAIFLTSEHFRQTDSPFAFSSNDHSENADLNAFYDFWYEHRPPGNLIAYQNLVPVSLILTVEVVKTVQVCPARLDLRQVAISETVAR
ncbi:MAG: hypothetical protein BJ554DRAFT_6617 [Olpidium bornovanus]|uniref:P-type ATPase N-terminal domain-containing protein n=1 Tax=Olpidium bornovanus TaxID=278681 RepID=A0A8H7ZYB0_9FUNG|nr:MAG: hypothetical protein BJ554DRAFT_6617 [Olpidium bornovanus]